MKCEGGDLWLYLLTVFVEVQEKALTSCQLIRRTFARWISRPDRWAREIRSSVPICPDRAQIEGNMFYEWAILMHSCLAEGMRSCRAFSSTSTRTPDYQSLLFCHKRRPSAQVTQLHDYVACIASHRQYFVGMDKYEMQVLGRVSVLPQ